MLGIALALASAASWGTADFLGGLTTKQLSILVVSAVSQFAGLVFMVMILVVLARGPADSHVIVLGLAAGVCGVIGLAALYSGLAIGPMGVFFAAESGSVTLAITEGARLPLSAEYFATSASVPAEAPIKYFPLIRVRSA